MGIFQFGKNILRVAPNLHEPNPHPHPPPSPQKIDFHWIQSSAALPILLYLKEQRQQKKTLTTVAN